MGESREAVYKLKAIVDSWVKPRYRRSMYLNAISMYKQNYFIYKNKEETGIDDFNPLEKTINDIIFEVNSRASKM